MLKTAQLIHHVMEQLQYQMLDILPVESKPEQLFYDIILMSWTVDF